MPVNEFEKQVQKLMEELKVSPSENVWPKVEERIRERKKRRRLIVFPLLFGLMLLGYLGASYWFPENKIAIHKKQSEKENKPVVSTIQKKNSSPLPKNSLNEHSSVFIPSTQSKITTGNIKANGYHKNFINDKVQPDLNLSKIEIQKTATQNYISEQAMVDKTKNQTAIINEKNNDNFSEVNIDSNKNANVTHTMDTLIRDTQSTIAGGSENKPEDIATETIKKRGRTSNKLNWGIHFSAGASGVSENIFPIVQTERSANLNFNSSANFVSPVRYFPPSKSTAGFAFRTGVVVEKKISRRSGLSAGLVYNYYSNRIKVGVAKDTAIVIANSFAVDQIRYGYYQGNPQNDYSNKYHFIELPLEYHLQLNKGKKTPITWDAGVSLSRLITSNGLVYDTAYGGIYFKNKGLLNKNNIGLSTGFSFSINLKNSMRFSVGPYIRFGLTSLYKNNAARDNHLWYGGIKINLLFPQK